jgi:3beta-hydroxy-delta5-steroid dehydrogenase/steroid delta-isomerase
MGDTLLTADLGRVLVTGGAGFVGANLVKELLDRGYRVRAFDRVPSPLPPHEQLQVLQGDICDRRPSRPPSRTSTRSFTPRRSST